MTDYLKGVAAIAASYVIIRGTIKLCDVITVRRLKAHQRNVNDILNGAEK